MLVSALWTSSDTTLEKLLKKHSEEGVLYEKLLDNKVRCYACGHRCSILDGRAGVCRIRFNEGGRLYVPSGYVTSLQLDPVEKKPFFHAYPGSLALSFGMLGCDYHCAYCQNWITSQALRDSLAGASITRIAPEEFAIIARQRGARMITSTYNEPLITSEWAVKVFQEAKKIGLVTSYVSNGNATPEVLDYLRPWLDLYKVDLKSFQDENYRKLGGRLQAVLDTIKALYEQGFWVEIVTLVVPGFNDSNEELADIARFLASISPDIPWHVTAFHKDYKMEEPGNTSPATLIKAVEIGLKAGLHFVYAGNIPTHVKNYENTYCHSCGTLLIERYGFRVFQHNIKGGLCPKCHTPIAGRWN